MSGPDIVPRQAVWADVQLEAREALTIIEALLTAGTEHAFTAPGELERLRRPTRELDAACAAARTSAGLRLRSRRLAAVHGRQTTLKYER